MQSNSKKIQQIIDRAIDHKNLFGAVFSISSPELKLTHAAGNFKPDTAFFIASTTKLFVTALVMIARREGRLKLDDPMSKFLEHEHVNGLHQYQGTDSSASITIRQLLAHTSGLPDYFQQKQNDGTSLDKVLFNGSDQSWTFEQIINWTKSMPAKFFPGQRGRAFYSDTNFQLLGKILENIYGKAFARLVVDKITEPLSMPQTYIYQDLNDQRPVPIYYKDQPLNIAKAMTSFGPDGGGVSSADDLMKFALAFFQGNIFPMNYFDEMQKWNSLFFPLKSGVGIHQFQLPRLFSPFKPIPALIGHSGLSGAFCFYAPKNELYLTGTVNQINNPSNSYKLLVKILSYF